MLALSGLSAVLGGVWTGISPDVVKVSSQTTLEVIMKLPVVARRGFREGGRVGAPARWRVSVSALGMWAWAASGHVQVGV